MTHYKQLILQADVKIRAYKELPPEKTNSFGKKYRNYIEIYSEWLQSYDLIEFAPGEYLKVFAFVTPGGCHGNVDITEFAEVIEESSFDRIKLLTTGIVQPYLPVYKVYFKPPVKVEEYTQFELLYQIHAMLSNDLQNSYSDILDQFTITKKK